ncbi:MAG: hypothetical protein AAFV29_13745, partial [Myxococcota bacterium]
MAWFTLGFMSTAVACTTQLKVASDDESIAALSRYSGGRSGPPRGILYYLPTTVFDFEVEWQLTECGNASVPDIDFEVRPRVVRRSIPDVERPFVIDYSALGTDSAESNLTVTFYEGGVIKSINADIKDRTRAIVGNVLTAVVDASQAVASRMLQAAGVSSSPCTDEVMGLLFAYKTAQKQMNDRRRTLDRLMAQADPDDARVDAARTEMEAAQSRRDLNAAALTVRQKFFWKPDDFTNEGEQSLVLQLPAYRMQRFFKPSLAKAKGPQGGLVMEAMGKSVELRVVLRNLGKRAWASGGANPGDHFIYRNPGWVEFTMARTLLPSRLLLQEQFELPQAGVYVALPLKNGAFDSQTLSAKFRPTG